MEHYRKNNKVSTAVAQNACHPLAILCFLGQSPKEILYALLAIRMAEHKEFPLVIDLKSKESPADGKHFVQQLLTLFGT
jgi:hypothetical protein